MWPLMCLFSNIYVSFPIWTGFSNATVWQLLPLFLCTQNSVHHQNKYNLQAVKGQETTSKHCKTAQSSSWCLSLISFPTTTQTTSTVRSRKKLNLLDKKQEYTCFIVAESGRTLCLLSTAYGWPGSDGQRFFDLWCLPENRRPSACFLTGVISIKNNICHPKPPLPSKGQSIPCL